MTKNNGQHVQVNYRITRRGQAAVNLAFYGKYESLIIQSIRREYFSTQQQWVEEKVTMLIFHYANQD